MKFPSLLLATLTLFTGAALAADDNATKFEKDRQAILGMAGDFTVGFHFQETLSLHEGYEIEKKPYDEEAHETVKVIEDSGRKIVLQHLLQVGPAVVKHWAQTWVYEDTEILEFQGDRTWTVKKLTAEEAKGRWSQRVTQTDDSPRYEGIAAWVHYEGCSDWTATANRPLPRREITSGRDYDLLVVTNRHTVTPKAWYHEQDNTKWVKRDGKEYPLCREIGFNPYTRVEGYDFGKANVYWDKTSAFWKDVRQVWAELLPAEGSVKVPTKTDDARLQDIIDNFVEETEEGKAPSLDKIREALKPFVIAAVTK